jgi:glycosyltransferase 2 family protein
LKLSDPVETPPLRPVRHLWPVGLLLIAFALVAWSVGFAEVGAALGSVSLPTLGLMLAASSFNLLGRSLRWFLLVRSVAPHDPASAAAAMPRQFLVYLAGYALTLTPGRAGEVLRAWLARKTFDMPFSTGLSLVIADRFYDAVALAIILFVAGLLLGSAPAAAGVTMAIVAAALAIAGWLSSTSAIWRRTSERLPRFAKPILGLQAMIVQFSVVSRPRMLPKLTLPSLAGWGVQALVPAMILRDMGFALGVWDAVFVFALATLVGGASFLPGGLGGFEATMVALLTSRNIPLATAIAATLVVRVTTLLFSVALGIVMLFVWTCLYGRGPDPNAER